MKVLKIDETSRRNLCAETEYRDRTAARLGASMIETLRKIQLASDDDEQGDEQEAGAALVELFRMGKLALRDIESSEAKQVACVTSALKALGVDVKQASYTVDPEDGRVLKLRDGQWTAIFEDKR